MLQVEFWSKLKKFVREVSVAAADFSEEKALIGKLKINILALNRKANGKSREIGERFRELARTSPRPDPYKVPELRTLLSEVDDLEKQADLKRREIDKVADQLLKKRVKRDEARKDKIADKGSKPSSGKEKAPKKTVKKQVKSTKTKKSPIKATHKKTKVKPVSKSNRIINKDK